jgi:hypothetical protein
VAVVLIVDDEDGWAVLVAGMAAPHGECAAREGVIERSRTRHATKGSAV